MLDNRNIRGEQEGVGGTPAGTGIVEVERIDSYEGRSLIYEKLRGLGG